MPTQLTLCEAPTVRVVMCEADQLRQQQAQGHGPRPSPRPGHHHLHAVYLCVGTAARYNRWATHGPATTPCFRECTTYAHAEFWATCRVVQVAPWLLRPLGGGQAPHGCRRCVRQQGRQPPRRLQPVRGAVPGRGGGQRLPRLNERQLQHPDLQRTVSSRTSVAAAAAVPAVPAAAAAAASVEATA